MEIVPAASRPVTVGASTASSSASTAVYRSTSKTAAVAQQSSPPPPMAVPSIGLQSDDDGLGALYDLAEQEQSARTEPDRPQCPSCRSELEKNAVICTSCGYDIRNGKSLTTAKQGPVLPYATPKGKGKNKSGPVDHMAPQGSFVIGLIVAIVFGVVCSILWIVIEVVTGYEIGLLATVIGWTVGLGMQIGQKGYSHRGGIAAAMIAVTAIVLPKLLMLALIAVVLPHNKDMAKIGFELFPPLTLLFIFLGIGAAYRTANGSSK
jgi:hypothetical protein